MKPYKTLTDSFIKAAKPKDKPYKISDSARLYLLVTVAGSKYWKWNYRLDNKDATYTIGEYPQIGLAQARELRAEAQKIVELGFHPLQHKKIQLAKSKQETATTFWSVTEEWMEHKKDSWSPSYTKQIKSTMGRYVRDGKVGILPINEITAADMFDLITGVANRDVPTGVERRSKAPSLALLLRQWCSGVFRHAIVSGKAKFNPVASLNAGDMVTRPKVKHNHALTLDELRSLLKSLNGFSGMRSTGIAIELLMLTFVRTGELIQAQWHEFDLDKKQWVIPASRMKIKDADDHLVPLSSQAIALLNELKELSGNSKHNKPQWLFTNIRNPENCMSATTINRALERMGFNGKGTIGFTAHGFRGTASTMLHENGSRTEVIEAQLAHKEPNSVKAAYNKAQYIPERIVLMQGWADHLQHLKMKAVDNTQNKTSLIS
jgi:integrase